MKKKAILTAFIGVSVAYLLYRVNQNTGAQAAIQANQSADNVSSNTDSSALSNSIFNVNLSFSDYAPALTEYITGDSQMTPQGQNNLDAFLLTIRKWESSTDDSAYTMLYGGGHFSSFDDHPRIRVPIKGTNKFSTAAGAYQIIAPTWDYIKRQINLNDFSPASQDAAAIQLIKNRGAYNLILAGYFNGAVNAIKKEWASVPGSPYGQSTASPSQYMLAYQSFGGTVNV